MRVRDSSGESAWSPGAGGRLVREPTRFVGREFELEWLERGLAASARGAAGVRFVSGEAGIGKTRLARELARGAKRDGFRVAYGRGHDGFGVSYLPFEGLLAALRSGAPEHEKVRSGAEALARLFERVTELRDADDPFRTAREGDERRRTFHDVARGLFRHAQSGAVLLVLEDLQWFDSASIELLGHIAFLAADTSITEPLPLLIVCTFREAEAPAALQRFLNQYQHEEICESLVLQGFDADDHANLVRELGIERASQQLLSRLHRAATGNPLHVEELIQQLRRERVLVRRSGRWEATVDPVESSLPMRLADVEGWRAREISTECRRALTSAAFMGREFDLAGLATVAEVPADRLEALLREAEAAGLLTSSGSSHAFARAETRRAFYALPGRADRRSIHRRVAQWLETTRATGGRRPAQELAQHWLHGGLAGDEARAVEIAMAAADEAASVYDWALASYYYAEARKANAASPVLEPDQEADLYHRSAVAAYGDSDPDLAQTLYECAMRSYVRCGSVAGVARAQLGRARTLLTLRSVPYGTLIDVAPLERTARDLGDAEPALRGLIAATLSDAYGVGKSLDRALALAEEAHRIGRETGDAALRAYAGVSLGNCHSQRVALDASREAFEAALTDARACGETWIEGWALQRLPMTHAWLGRLDEAEQCVREAAEHARQLDHWADHSLALGAQTAIVSARGDFEAVEETARRTAHLVRRTGYPWGGALALTALAGARALQGERDEANDALSILAEPRRIFEEPGVEMEFLVAVARLRVQAMADEVPEECVVQARNMQSLVEHAGLEIGMLAAPCAFVEIAQAFGDAELAGRCRGLLQSAAERGAVFTAGCEFLIPRVLGIAAAMSDAGDDAATHLRRALAIAKRVRARPELARCSLELADVLLAAGSRSRVAEARSLLDQATRLLGGLRLVGLERRAREVAERAGLALPALGSAHDEGPGLDRLDRAILRAVARGRTDAEIGEHLLLTAETVSARRIAIFDRIGVEGTTGAAAFALANDDEAVARLYLQGLGSEGARRRILLVSDIVASTQLIQELGDASARKRLRGHNRLIRANTRQYGGEEIQHTGDGFILAFDQADAAIDCALAIQAGVQEADRDSAAGSLTVRIGLHAGLAAKEEGRLFGIAIHATFRVCSQASSGEILATREVIDEASAGRFSFIDIGPVALRGFTKPMNLFRLAGDDQKG